MGPWWIRAGGRDIVASPSPVSELGDAVTQLAAGAQPRPIVLLAADLAQAASAIEQLQQAAGQVLQISALLPGEVVRESESEMVSLRRALDDVPAPIFSKDASGVFRACNQAFEDYLGLGRDEIIGATVHDVSPLELARVYDAADRALMAEGGQQIYDAQVRYADGTIHDVTFFKAVLRNQAGEIDGLSGVMVDLTSRRRLEAELVEHAETDELTGLQNRATFVSRASLEIERSASSESHPSFLLLDLDGFKAINDRWGPATGDEALCAVAACFQSALRSADALARTGGGEFAVMLPSTSPDGAAMIAERIRQSVADLRVESKPALRLTVSVGVSGWASAQTADDVLQAAAAALQEAKRTGRNRVVVAPETAAAARATKG
jgi:diguanylate cyclase (GGDEF)-like protein/PAS domain S-box-containing protein